MPVLLLNFYQAIIYVGFNILRFNMLRFIIYRFIFRYITKNDFKIEKYTFICCRTSKIMLTLYESNYMKKILIKYCCQKQT